MNLFELPIKIPQEELVELLVDNKKVRVEKIISCGQVSPPGFWYDQEQNEWVALLQGEANLSWQDGRVQTVRAGDWLLLPAHEKHRVEWTSQKPPCVWLAVFF